MPVLLDYQRKSPTIQAFQVGYTEAELNDAYEWLRSVLPTDSEIRMNVTMRTLSYSYYELDVLRTKSVTSGSYLALDENNKVFVLDQTLLDAFFDLVPL